MQQSLGDQQRAGFFLPNFCSVRTAFVVVVSAELLAVVVTLAAMGGVGEFFQLLSMVSLLVQWVALSTAGLLCLSRGWFWRLDNRLAGLLAWLMLLLVTSLVSEAAYFLDGQLGSSLAPPGRFGLLYRSLGIAAIVGLLVLHYLHLQYLWRCQIESENSARLQALHSRIRPHFLFNSMNTIASLTRSRPDLAEQVVENLADLFRASLGDVGRNSTLGEELELARQYLNIEALRLGERLRVEWDLQGLPENALMPPMILQPLLENAVYHGIEPAEQGGILVVAGLYRRRRINLSIRNTLPETASGELRKGNRMALENIRQRLSSLFGMEGSLTESRVDGEYQVRLVIPHPWRSE